MAICAAMPCWQTSKKRRVDISSHQAIATREDGIERHQLQTSKKRVDISYSLKRHQGIDGRRGHQSHSRHRRERVDIRHGRRGHPKERRHRRRRVDIRHGRRGHPKDSRHRSGRVDISYGRRGHQGARRFHHASSIFTTQWLLRTHPSITGFFLCTSSSTSSMASASKVSQTPLSIFFISYLFTMHLDHLQPEQHIFTVDLAVCFAGIKFHHFLCILLAIIFPYLHHIEA